MEKQVDEFFRKKLEEHTFTLSAPAWDKIEATLSKKNKITIVWRLAAALALMSCLLWAGLNWQVSKPAELTEIKSSVIKQSEPTIAKINSDKEEKKQNKITSNASKKVSINSIPPTEAAATKAESIEVEKTKIEEIIVAETVTVISAEAVAPVLQPIVLEYRLQPVGTPAIAETEEKKGFKGFFNAAKEIKNGEDGLGLQTLKDNILAFNFKKEKGKPEEEKNY